ncbi:hypothetical protein G6O67_005785 [Ophiocordyceps sinensis]|uniref:tRNA (Uracil-5-)-methyltransferase n=1 Tax=Ophiocordyceps sinensis TaxID=72228 RepID=A0A8H4PN07_9HYPO|nr:hypothetical protein G6O67_005785 [Ophiocordyceps sinensis]
MASTQSAASAADFGACSAAAPPPAAAAALGTNRPPKRSSKGHSRDARESKQKRTKRERNMAEGSSEEVLRHDVRALLESRGLARQSAADAAPIDDAATAHDEPPLPAEGSHIDVDVVELSSAGSGLAMQPGSSQVYLVPFTLPGDVATVKVFRHLSNEHRQTSADLVAIVKPSPLRDDSLVRCRYFGSCGGCQFQMLDYPEQLRHKRRVIERAFRNFANLPAHLVPAIGDTIASPLQYGYRTKLTPHFDGPPGSQNHGRKRRDVPKPFFESCPDIGFMHKGRRTVIDIEDCPIGTDVVRLGMKRERARIQSSFASFKRGATLLLRENTRRYLADDCDAAPGQDKVSPHKIRSEGDGFVDVKSCETNSRATTTEYVGDHVFTNPAGSFFQNNNAILPVFTAYVKDHILPPVRPGEPAIGYLIDAYSGAGLFTVALASVFRHSTGIDVAADSIASARRNAALNGLGDDRCLFIAADASQLFGNVSYPPDETLVVLDPPRKGCDADFLAQLSAFGPKRILYVSCNVHTQARDVGVLVRGDAGGAAYRLESLVGFDFFPQTAHVEGVAILNRHDGQ